ncbi:MAG: bifunctional folylpolyglutamate synthase/dihydrofolate synthase [Actinomycetota bacterium]|nr:bifunctional folylpolyglutamate synthase/dihydrofolate synthase [Actinomycetota bacterium]
MPLEFREALASIDARGFGIKPDLSRIARLLELLDDPQLAFPTIHISGTNGKTSTARMIGTILAAHGLNTGIYTSPHLRSVRERMAIAAWDSSGLIWEEISEEEFAATLYYLQPLIALVEADLGQMTYFEVTTALAFDWMAERSVGAGVVEVGLGGRWDATNLVQSAIAVLTTVDVDHRPILGSTRLENAKEKVDIVKPGATVVSAVQAPDVRELLEGKAQAEGARLVLSGRDFRLTSDETAVGGRLVGIQTARARYEDLYLPLHGAHQSANLALAVAAAEEFLGRPLDHRSLAAAVRAVTSPGRLEVVARHPLVVLDGAHNPHAAAALALAVQQEFRYRNLTSVVAISQDKDLEGILSKVVPMADRVIISRFANARAADPEELALIASQYGKPVQVVPSLDDSVDLALSTSSEEDLVLVTGSLYAVGEARKHLARGLESRS